MLVPIYTLYIGLLVPSSADTVLCLLPSFLRCCSCLLCCSSCSGSPGCTAVLLCQLVHCSGLLQPLLYKLDFAVDAGIACLAFSIYDWFPLHAGIVCLTSLAFIWPTAWWDSLSKLLHAGIACLTSQASIWLIACWHSLSAHSMLG